MSQTTALAVTPNRRPRPLTKFPNAHGWSPNIWDRLLAARGEPSWFVNDDGLNRLWREVEILPPWQQVPLVLTFDTGVIPWEAFDWAAAQLDEFEQRLPAPDCRVNHVPGVASLLRSRPETAFIGLWGTSVSENPFDPWNTEADEPGHGLPLADLYILERHRNVVAAR